MMMFFAKGIPLATGGRHSGMVMTMVGALAGVQPVPSHPVSPPLCLFHSVQTLWRCVARTGEVGGGAAMFPLI